MSESKEKKLNALQNPWVVKANQHILDGATGELFIENRPEEFTDPITKEKGTRMTPTALTLGDILSRHVSEGTGANPEEKFTCAMLGGKLHDHRNLKGAEGHFDVTVEHLALIKRVVEAIKFGGGQQGQTELFWLKAAMLYLLDAASVGKDDEREFFQDRYAKLPEKLAVWESEHPDKDDGESQDQPVVPGAN